MAWYDPRTWRENKQIKKPIYARSYQAAKASRLLADFLSPSSSADKEIRNSIRTLRDRARELCRNEPYAQRALQIFRTNVVGENGLHFQSKARNIPRPNEILGELDQQGNDIIESRWREWGRAGICDVTGKYSWIDLQNLVIDGLIRDGEVLIKHIRNADNDYGYAVQLIEPDFLDEEYNTTNKDTGNRIIMGVEINNFNRPVAYHLFAGPSHPYDDLGYGINKAGRIRVPANEIIHIFTQERSQQTRGVTHFAPVMDSQHMLNGYLQAELIAARLAASKSLFLSSPDGVAYDGDDYADLAPIMDVEPGSITQLKPGTEIQPWSPDHPMTAFADFHKSVLRAIASGLGISYVSLSNNLEGVSYSSIRQGATEERDHFKALQKFLIQHFAEPIFREWLSIGIAKGVLPFPDNRFEKFASAAHFKGRGFSPIDPQKEIRAWIDGLQNGIYSPSDVQAHFGRDAEAVFSQIQADLQLAEKFGVEMNLLPLGPKGPATPSVESDDL